METILGSSDLHVLGEATVWSAFKIWLNANPSCEAKQVHDLLSQVRLHLLPGDFFLNEVFDIDVIWSNADCRALIHEARKPKPVHNEEEKTKRKRKISQAAENSIKDEQLRPRYCSHLENSIFILTTPSNDNDYYKNHQVALFDPDSKVTICKKWLVVNLIFR